MKRNFVLCVDDDLDDCALLGEALSKMHKEIELEFLHNAQTALDFLNNADDDNLPRLIIMDINMPGIDGKETFLRLQKMPRFKAIPVVLMSTNVRDPDLKHMEDNGTTILRKPHNFSGYEDIAKTIIHLFK